MRSLPFAIVFLVLAGACEGAIGDPAGRAPAASGSCQAMPGRVGLQRLTRDEYDRTVRDLFGVTSAPAAAFPPDSSTNGFDNNAESLGTSPQLTELLLDAADAVAAEALANGRDEIVTCDPAADADACARSTLTALALRVYRRPATDAEVDDLLAVMQASADEGEPFDRQVELALSAMLVAPQFLFRGIPVAPQGDPGEVVALDPYALATRLSYFLWGSTPDDELLARAADGSLRRESALRDEFDRMLADPRSSALFDGFVTQWLALGKLAGATPDPAVFPEWSEALRAEMAEEPRRFFEDLRARDGSALELVTGTRTFASEGLAAIYGVPDVAGPELQPVTTDPARRAGVLTMPAILTMTSGPSRPNIVKRGVWLAQTILCAAPRPPPEGVPPPPDPQPGETERERLARHRRDPSCASCHELIDPLGFGFEHYDALGRWRDEADGAPVDDLGRLPDGTTYVGVVEMARHLETSGEFRTCIAEKLVTYALGRTVTADERCALEAMGTELVTPDQHLSDLLWAVVTSLAFQAEEIRDDEDGGDP